MLVFFSGARGLGLLLASRRRVPLRYGSAVCGVERTLSGPCAAPAKLSDEMSRIEHRILSCRYTRATVIAIAVGLAVAREKCSQGEQRWPGRLPRLGSG